MKKFKLSKSFENFVKEYNFPSLENYPDCQDCKSYSEMYVDHLIEFDIMNTVMDLSTDNKVQNEIGYYMNIIMDFNDKEIINSDFLSECMSYLKNVDFFRMDVIISSDNKNEIEYFSNIYNLILLKYKDYILFWFLDCHDNWTNAPINNIAVNVTNKIYQYFDFKQMGLFFMSPLRYEIDDFLNETLFSWNDDVEKSMFVKGSLIRKLGEEKKPDFFFENVKINSPKYETIKSQPYYEHYWDILKRKNIKVVN